METGRVEEVTDTPEGLRVQAGGTWAWRNKPSGKKTNARGIGRSIIR
jgi:hypothetical protein